MVENAKTTIVKYCTAKLYCGINRNKTIGKVSHPLIYPTFRILDHGQRQRVASSNTNYTLMLYHIAKLLSRIYYEVVVL